MFSRAHTLADFDPELWQSIEDEARRQEEHVELIASENYASPRVLAAQGSQLTNKYAEGYPGRRYYGGCEYVDVAERLAIERARQLFGADYANVQPHSGSQANAAVFMALMEPGDTLLGMSLAHGGHLTHGAPVSFSGKIYRGVQYGIDVATGLVDYAQVEHLARECRPKVIVAGFSAYSRAMDWQRFRAIADAVGGTASGNFQVAGVEIDSRDVVAGDLFVALKDVRHQSRRQADQFVDLADLDAATGQLKMLGKTFKGMTDEMLAWQTERFLGLETHREGHVVHVRPEQVVEIAFDGLQRSTRYPGGLALRFARVVR